MKEGKDIRPPKWAERFLSWYCRPELLEDLQGDLNEYFERNIKSKGIRPAKWIYAVDVLKFFRSYTVRKPKLQSPLNSVDLLKNNVKTSFRNIGRNKLFTIINVTGLAVSMCVGLIIIALVLELKSFDTFHENYSRIYRVRNALYGPNFGREEYASTSLKAARQIKESVSGIEASTIIRRGFNKDVNHDGKVIPLKGLWADESFFTIFTFEVISGTAGLKDPNVVVLTEKSALKLFGSTDIVGESLLIDSINYSVTAVVKDPPINSHVRFDMVGSFVTIDNQKLLAGNTEWMKWDEMWSTYLYVLLPEQTSTESIQGSLSAISAAANKTLHNHSIELNLQPLSEVVLGYGLSMEIGPSGNKVILWTMGVFAIIVIISACFNYTNLSIARALRRTREVGIRKVTGASRLQVIQQFLLESVLVSLISLIIAYFLFLLIRDKFISMDNTFQEMVTLQPTAQVYLCFIGLAVVIGLFAGLLPAIFFSKINAIQILKDSSSVRLFKYINLRKGLIIFQYSLSILFIVAVSIEYNQYQYAMAFDLGFKTDNILTVELSKNNPSLLEKELLEIPEISRISKSNYISSVGASNASCYLKYDGTDSTNLHYNFIDEGYIPLHEHKLLAGENFTPTMTDDAHVIINESAVHWMKLATPLDAIGEELLVEGKGMKIIGVVKDFNYDRINYPIKPFAFRYDSRKYEMMSLKIQSTNMMSTFEKVESAWKRIDPLHPLKARFYDEHIQSAYNKMSWMAKIVGSIAFLSVFIASFGLLGMVIFTTETRLREISIRKVLGASEGKLILMMSRGFIGLLVLSAAIAIPMAYYLFDQIIFSKIAYRSPIGFVDLFSGTFCVIGIALIMIGYQTLKVARSNPAQILKTE